MPTLNDDSDNVYGVNNLNYLQQQLKGYDAESNHSQSSSQEEGADDDLDQSETVHGDGLSSHSDNSTSNANEDESSGDGAADETENKGDTIPIPTTNIDPPSTVATQLQRLSQIMNSLSSDGNQSSDLRADDLNEFLSLHKIKSEKASSKESMTINSNARPMPSNGRIHPLDLDQILDLQKKLNKLGLTRDALSTPATPVQYSVSGSGYYPADATTVHINAATPIQNPMFPEPGYSSSQIVVNRPGGSILFSLPNGNVQYSSGEQQQQQHQNGGSISEETLKKLLDLSKQMSTTSQPANIPGFITPTNPTNLYGQPIIRPIFYNFPVQDILQNYDQNNNNNNYYHGSIDRMQDADSNNKRPMQKIASVSGHIESEDMNLEHRPDDIGLSTVIHNHIPITISNPNPTHSTVHRYQASSTPRPYSDDQNSQQPQLYDSYGHRRPNEQSDSNVYYPYPPFEESSSHNRPSPYNHQRPSSTPYNNNIPSQYGNQRLPPTQETPTHYVKISQSPPDEYPSYNPGIISAHQPIPTFSSDDNSYTTKFYTPSTHLSNNNVNHLVPVEQTYPTLQPTSYIPNRRPNYAPTSPTYMTGYSASSLKSGSSERPYDDESNEDIYGGGIDGSLSSQDDLSGSAEQSSHEVYENLNMDQSSENGNVMDLLPNYNNGLTQTISSTVSTGGGGGRPSASNEKNSLFEYSPSQSEKHKQFVNLGGNFISLESYQSSIEPFLPSNSMLSTRIEVLTCATGVRQANSTDCTKYFVCNSKTGKVLSYSCPPYTAFNPDTKICNAKTYSECYPNSVKTKITIDTNKRIQQQAQLSLLQAQRIKNEALKAQQLAHMIKLETQKILDANKRRVGVGAKATSAPASLPTAASTRLKKGPQRVPAQTNAATGQIRQGGKRRIPCRAEGKLADNLSKYNYFLCFKDKEGKMRARRLLCPAKLIFCASTKLCTSAQRCVAKSN